MKILLALLIITPLMGCVHYKIGDGFAWADKRITNVTGG